MSSINSNASRKRHHDDGVADSGSEMTTAEMKSLLHQSLSRLKSVESNVSQMQSDIDELKKANSYLQNEIASMRKKNCSTMMSGDMTPQCRPYQIWMVLRCKRPIHICKTESLPPIMLNGDLTPRCYPLSLMPRTSFALAPLSLACGKRRTIRGAR